jgi:uncharacterized protein (TIGR01777 family)
MKILLAGGSGFLGQLLSTYFLNQGDELKILTRTPKRPNEIYWDARQLGDWISEIEWADAVINLTGKSVDCRYTEKNRQLILNSRIESTAILAKAIAKADNPPEIWINSSSATIYVHSESQQMTEDEGIIGDDFSMNICKKWEEEFFKIDLNTTRRVALRTSIVLGKNGGAYPKLKTLTKLFLGGKQGNGRQFISWIHADDFCRSVHFILHHPEIVGPINLVAPNPETNKNFMSELRKSLNRPFGIGQPVWLLEVGAVIVQTETELLLKSRNVAPERLLEKRFEFLYPTLPSALKNLSL